MKHARGDRETQRDGGYMLVVMAMLMVALMVFGAFVVDIGLLYSRGNKLQAAADAAALAGVAYMPLDFERAEAAARAAAKANGFDPATDDAISVTVSRVYGLPRRLRVEIRNDRVPTIFGSVVKDSFVVSRRATGEYVPTIPVGSPVNLLGYAPTQNFWLAVNGYCTAKEDGDLYLSRHDGTRNATGTYGCGTGPQPKANTDYNNTRSGAGEVPANQGGYSYLVRVPCATVADPSLPCPSTDRTSTQVRIQIFDPHFNPGFANSPDVHPKAECNDPASTLYNACPVTTTVRVYPPDNTPTTYADDVAATTPIVFTTRGCACTEAQWHDLFTIPAGSRSGSWRVQVTTGDNEANSFGVNGFSLRAFAGSEFAQCTLALSSCIGVSGDASLSLFAQAPTSSAEFYLARFAPAAEFRGKQVRVALWDAGEGGQSIQILPPGTPSGQTSVNGFPFSARLGPPGLAGCPTDSNWSFIGNVLNIEGDPIASPGCFTVTGLARANPTKFNGRLVELTVTIPADYGLDANGQEATLADDGWWRIRYNFTNGTVRDRTTWMVKLVGDPVHLVSG